MPPKHYTIYECAEVNCQLRFPLYEDERWQGVCPRCQSAVFEKGHYTIHADPITSPDGERPMRHVSALLDNLRSTFNVGSIFRSADGAGLGELFLCGTTPTPDHPKVRKTALGAENTVPWRYHTNALTAAQELQKSGHVIWAIEMVTEAESLFTAPAIHDGMNVTLILGNEISGIDPDLLGMADRTIYIPMGGTKGSLNVAIAFSIAVFWWRGQTARLG